MSRLLKTTVYLDREVYARLKNLARLAGRSPAALIREAVAQYASGGLAARLPASLGAGRSGRRDLAERSEALLRGLGEEP